MILFGENRTLKVISSFFEPTVIATVGFEEPLTLFGRTRWDRRCPSSLKERDFTSKKANKTDQAEDRPKLASSASKMPAQRLSHPAHLVLPKTNSAVTATAGQPELIVQQQLAQLRFQQGFDPFIFFPRSQIDKKKQKNRDGAEVARIRGSTAATADNAHDPSTKGRRSDTD